MRDFLFYLAIGCCAFGAAPHEYAAADSAPPAPAPVLSLVVSGDDEQHLQRHLNQLSNLHKGRGVQIGNVAIIGMSYISAYREQVGRSAAVSRFSGTTNHFEAARAGIGPLYTYLQEADVPLFKIVQSQVILGRLKISTSPTWVVRHKGRDYVFEGFSNPSMLFDKKGIFTGE